MQKIKLGDFYTADCCKVSNDVLGINLTTISSVSPILLICFKVLHSDLCPLNLVSQRSSVSLHTLITHVLFLTSFLSFCPSKRVSSPYFLFPLVPQVLPGSSFLPSAPTSIICTKISRQKCLSSSPFFPPLPCPPASQFHKCFVLADELLCLIRHVVLPIPSAGIDMACILLTQQSIA